MDRASIEQVFEAFDTDGRGYLTLNQFEKLGEDMNLSTPDVRQVFDTMDANSDGLVEQSEFLDSFNSLTALALNDTPPSGGENPPEILITESVGGFNENNSNNTKEDEDKKEKQTLDVSSGQRRRPSAPKTSGLRSKSWHSFRRNKIRKSSLNADTTEGDKVYAANQGSWDTFAESMGEAIYALSSYEGISQVYKTLESAGNFELLRIYETMIQAMVKEFLKVQKEMSELETSFEKSKELNNQQLTAMEEEMESQIQKEKELAKEERKKADEESERTKAHYEQQIDQLQSAIKKLKQFDERISSGSPYEKELETMRNKLRKLNKENSSLKQKLTETETNLILAQNNVKEMELANQEKTLKFIRDEDEVTQVHEDRERISKEVESLYTSNRQLIDSNDNLREALERSIKRSSAQSARTQNGGLPIEFINSPDYLPSGRSSRGSILEFDALAECDPGRRTPERNGYLGHDLDNGIGSLREDFDDSETDWGDESFRRGSRLNGSQHLRSGRVHRHPSNASWTSSSSRRPKSRRRHYHRAIDYQNHSDDDRDVTINSDVTDDELRDISQSSTLSSGSRGRWSNRSGRGTPSSIRKVITPDVTLGHNKRWYKVILCGDAGVGKTSFIHRVCRNEFHRFTKSTLGVDFQVKTINIEHDKSISLQLWDTAGQERFRSISASYFRRAEGVLLLYDCTHQRSFINVRDWMETISSVIPEGSPIMICGHKVDLREEKELEGRPIVSAQEGAQLAANYGVLFVETSALDGCNVSNAITMLARHIKLDDDSDETASVKHLGVTSEKKDNQACCKQN